MFKIHYRAGLLAGMLLWAAAGAKATVLKSRPWPLTDKSYAAIDPISVRVERYSSEMTWLSQVGNRNGALTADLHLQPVASIEISRLYEDEDIDSIEALLEKARECAAALGANAVYLDKNLMRGEELDGMRFTAYRAEYKKHPIPPTFLVALPQMSIPASFLEEQIQDWEETHFGRIAVTFGPDEDRESSIHRLAKLKTGTPVRVVLRDGSALKGAISGMDEDNRLWIHPKGWLGLIRDKAVASADIRSVALLK